MFNKIKHLIENKDNRRIIENIISLFSLQGLTYLLPLITFPYLTRILGPDKYGLVAFALAFIGYFQILTDYGFNLSATREIAIHKDNSYNLSKIFVSVMAVKFLLMILSFIIMSILIISIEKFRNDWILYYLTFGLVIGNFLFPYWFFQGMEKMKHISLLNIATILIFTLLIFLFIRNASDYLYVPLINSIASIIIGITAIVLIFKKFNIKFIFPSKNDIISQFKEGWHVFLSTLAISLYTVSNIFILGIFANNVIVGYYSVAEKIIRVFMGLITPISQSIYPHISSLAFESKEKALNFISKISTFLTIGSLIVSFLIWIFAGLIVFILAGNQYQESIILIQIMSILPFVVTLNNLFGTQTMLTLNYKKAFSNIIIIGGIINIIVAFTLTPFYKGIGISISFVITESIITLLMYFYLRNKKINLFKQRSKDV